MVTSNLQPAPAPGVTGFVGDRRLPHRDVLLDEVAMGSILADALGRRVESCRRVRAKYRIGDSLRVSYEIGGGPEPLRISLRCFSEDGKDHGTANGGFRLPQLNTWAWVFPRDRKLSSLACFWNDDQVRNRLLGTTVDRIDLASYAPEKSATIRCAARGEVVGYTKLYVGHRHRSASAVHSWLRPRLADMDIGAPAVIAHDEELGLVVISAVAGETIAAREVPDDWRQLGGALAQLHSIEPPRWLPPFERLAMARLLAAGTLIAAVRPDVDRVVSRLLDRLDRHASEAVDTQKPTVLHGDMHAKNVLVDGSGRLSFIDLDQAAVGPAAAELGSIIAALRYELGDERADRRSAESEILSGYRERGDEPAALTLAWHIAAALLGERSLRAVNRVRLDGLDRLPSLLNAALEILEDATS